MCGARKAYSRIGAERGMNDGLIGLGVHLCPAVNSARHHRGVPRWIQTLKFATGEASLVQGPAAEIRQGGPVG